MEKNKYSTLSLPTSLVEEMKIWQLAFNASYGRPVSFEEMIRGLLDSLEDSEPGVVEELDKIMKKQPELMEKMSNCLRKSFLPYHISNGNVYKSLLSILIL